MPGGRDNIVELGSRSQRPQANTPAAADYQVHALQVEMASWQHEALIHSQIAMKATNRARRCQADLEAILGPGPAAA